MLKFQLKSNFKVPKINFQKDLRKIADQIIIPDMQKGIIEGIDIDDRAFPKNEAKTVARKGRNRVLQGRENKLKTSFRSKNKGKFNVVIDLKNQRRQIGKYLQVDGIRSNTLGRKHFKFFGISKLAEKLAMIFMKNRIGKAVKDAQ